MKRILIVLFFTFGNLYSQENLNPRKLVFSDDAILNYGMSSSFKSNGFDKNYNDNNFILGWNWGLYTSKNLDSALLMNSSHDFNLIIQITSQI